MNFKEYIEEQRKQPMWEQFLPRVMPWVARCLGISEEQFQERTKLLPTKKDLMKKENVDIQIEKINEMTEIEVCKIADSRLVELKGYLPNPNPKLEEIHTQVKAKTK